MAKEAVLTNKDGLVTLLEEMVAASGTGELIVYDDVDAVSVEGREAIIHGRAAFMDGVVRFELVVPFEVCNRLELGIILKNPEK